MRYTLWLLTILLLFSGISANAQLKKYKWTEDMCEFEGTYDSSKYSAAKIKNTVKLASYDGFELIKVDVTAWKYEDIDKLSLEALNAEYEPMHNELKNLDIVKSLFWERMKKEKLAEMERVYELSKATILGYKEPERLRDVTFAPSCVTNYAEPLIAGGDSLLKAWLKVNTASRKNNADPEWVKKKYEEQFNSDQKMQYAQIEVMMFGWWNCANRLARKDQRNDILIGKNLRMLFKRLKETCDEP